MISDVYLENLAGILTAYAILAILVERALHQVFHSKLFLRLEERIDAKTGDLFDLKPWLSMALCVWICTIHNLDMVAELYRGSKQNATIWITGLFIAGGSTGVYEFWKQARKIKGQK